MKSDFEFIYLNDNNIEGTCIHHNGHYIGCVPNVFPDDIEDMTEDEFSELLIENGILL